MSLLPKIRSRADLAMTIAFLFAYVALAGASVAVVGVLFANGSGLWALELVVTAVAVAYTADAARSLRAYRKEPR